MELNRYRQKYDNFLELSRLTIIKHLHVEKNGLDNTITINSIMKMECLFLD